MNKKKIIWGILIFIFFAIIVWIDIPYIFPTNNLIVIRQFILVGFIQIKAS